MSFDQVVQPQASELPSAVIHADVVLFAVKSTDTEAAGLQIRPHLQPGALVLCLQNGVDNAERLRAVLPGVDVAAAAVYVAAEMAGAGHLRHHGRTELIIAPSPRSAMLAHALQAAGVPTPGQPPAVGGGQAAGGAPRRRPPLELRGNFFDYLFLGRLSAGIDDIEDQPHRLTTVTAWRW